jgi:hypothetical protein
MSDRIIIQENERPGLVITPGPNTSSQSAPAPTVLFVASEYDLAQAGTVTLAWLVSGADTIEIDQGVGPVSANGQTEVLINSSTTLTLTATNTTGTTTQQVSVQVGATGFNVDFTVSANKVSAYLDQLTCTYAGDTVSDQVWAWIVRKEANASNAQLSEQYNENPSFIFTVLGYHTVELFSGNLAHAGYEKKVDIVEVTAGFDTSMVRLWLDPADADSRTMRGSDTNGDNVDDTFYFEELRDKLGLQDGIGNDIVFQQPTQSDQPVLSTLQGVEVAEIVNQQYIVSGGYDKSHWRFLHNGSKWTAVFLAECNGRQNNRIFATTSGGSVNVVGVFVEISSGEVSMEVIDGIDRDKFSSNIPTPDEQTVFLIAIEANTGAGTYDIYVDNLSTTYQSIQRDPKSNDVDPSRNMNIMRLPDGSNSSQGKRSDLIIREGIDSTWRLNVEKALKRKHNL